MEITFKCSICGEHSRDICEYCTKDTCENHTCSRCRRCSDCCTCEFRAHEGNGKPAASEINLKNGTFEHHPHLTMRVDHDAPCDSDRLVPD